MAKASTVRVDDTDDRSPSGAPADRWSDLMAAAQLGNGGAYNRLLVEVAAWLRRYYARCLPPSYVDDVVQEALAAMHAKRHTYEPGRPFKAWLAGIARYKWIDRLRSMGRERYEPLLPDDIVANDHGATVLDGLDVRRLLDRLKPAQASAIRLVKLDGYTIEEAAAATGQSMSLVKVNIHRGIARLAAIVDTVE